MATVDIVIQLFCWVDDRLEAVPRRPRARLWPSVLVTIGLLYALKGGSFRGFYRGLARDCAPLFGGPRAADEAPRSMGTRRQNTHSR